jgi:homoserine dehydrogenase
VVSHQATDAQLSATVAALRDMDIVREVTSVMRVEGGDE